MLASLNEMIGEAKKSANTESKAEDDFFSRTFQMHLMMAGIYGVLSNRANAKAGKKTYKSILELKESLSPGFASALEKSELPSKLKKLVHGIYKEAEKQGSGIPEDQITQLNTALLELLVARFKANKIDGRIWVDAFLKHISARDDVYQLADTLLAWYRDGKDYSLFQQLWWTNAACQAFVNMVLSQSKDPHAKATLKLLQFETACNLAEDEREIVAEEQDRRHECSSQDFNLDINTFAAHYHLFHRLDLANNPKRLAAYAKQYTAYHQLICFCDQLGLIENHGGLLGVIMSMAREYGGQPGGAFVENRLKPQFRHWSLFHSDEVSQQTLRQAYDSVFLNSSMSHEILFPLEGHGSDLDTGDDRKASRAKKKRKTGRRSDQAELGGHEVSEPAAASSAVEGPRSLQKKKRKREEAQRVEPEAAGPLASPTESSSDSSGLDGLAAAAQMQQHEQPSVAMDTEEVKVAEPPPPIDLASQLGAVQRELAAEQERSEGLMSFSRTMMMLFMNQPQMLASMFGGQGQHPQMAAPMFGAQGQQPQMAASMFGGQGQQSQMAASMFGGQGQQSRMAAPIFGGQADITQMGRLFGLPSMQLWLGQGLPHPVQGANQQPPSDPSSASSSDGVNLRRPR